MFVQRRPLVVVPEQSADAASVVWESTYSSTVAATGRVSRSVRLRQSPARPGWFSVVVGLPADAALTTMTPGLALGAQSPQTAGGDTNRRGMRICRES